VVRAKWLCWCVSSNDTSSPKIWWSYHDMITMFHISGVSLAIGYNKHVIITSVGWALTTICDRVPCIHDLVHMGLHVLTTLKISIGEGGKSVKVNLNFFTMWSSVIKRSKKHCSSRHLALIPNKHMACINRMHAPIFSKSIGNFHRIYCSREFSVTE
jgi:hypothetical protein